MLVSGDPLPGWTINANGTPALVPGTVEPGGYATVDLLGRYRITERVTLSVDATNLLDETYRRHVRFAFGGPGGFHGEPRRVMGNIRMAF